MARCGQIFAIWDELKIVAENDDEEEEGDSFDSELIDISDSDVAESDKSDDDVKVKIEPSEFLDCVVHVKTEGELSLERTSATSAVSLEHFNNYVPPGHNSKDSSLEVILSSPATCIQQHSQDPKAVNQLNSTDNGTEIHQTDFSTAHADFLPMIIKAESLNEQEAEQITCSPVVAALFPINNNWDGDHRFRIRVKNDPSVKKNGSSLYCKYTKKLYTSKDIPFRIHCSAAMVPLSALIRVTSVFRDAAHSLDIVKRCPTHQQEDLLKGIKEHDHLVQSLSKQAVYEKNSVTGRLSVLVPYEAPPCGTNESIYVFKLTCFSSCPGGLNRKPMMLLFTLELNGNQLGRQSIEVKICACPKRDLKFDLVKIRKKYFLDDLPIPRHFPQISAPLKNRDSEKIMKSSPVFSIKVKDVRLYEFLRELKILYEASHSALTTYKSAEEDNSIADLLME